MRESETRQAYLAMFAFLEAYYDRTKSDDLGALLGSMSLLPDGGTVDPAMWNDWVDAFQKAKDGKIDAGLRLTPPD